MPLNPEEAIAFAMREHARQVEELEAARRENHRLKTFLIDVMRTLKEIEINLQKALDKDT